MKKPGPNRIAELRQARKWSQRELANALNVHYMTISKLERGEMRLSQPWMESIAKALDVNPTELIEGTMQSRMVVMNGEIRDSNLLENLFGVFDEKALPEKKIIEFHYETQTDHIHLTSKTEQFQPAIRYGDILRFTNFIPYIPNPINVLGRICLVIIEADRSVFIGVLERGSETGTYDLRSPTSLIRPNLRPDRIYVLTMVLSGNLPG